MKQKLLLALCVIGMMAGAQNFAPVGARWYYDYSRWSGKGYVKIESVADTVIRIDCEDYHCSVLEKEHVVYDYSADTVFHTQSGREYVYSDEDAVYWFRNGRFYKLYDFSAETGDSWMIPGTIQGCDTTGRVIVAAKGDTVIDGGTFRYIKTEPMGGSQVWLSDTVISASIWAINGVILEKVGPVEGYMFPQYAPPQQPGIDYNPCDCDSEEGGALRCYSDAELSYETDNASYCDYLPLGSVEKLGERFDVYPNPFESHIMIRGFDFINAFVRIMDINGEVRYSTVADSELICIDMGKLKAGVYIIELMDNGFVFRKKIMKL